MSQPLLSVAGLRVDYVDVTAVRDVTFQVDAGTVFGLIGPNGAGKTSILASIATLVEPTYGSIEICGIPLLEEPRRALPRLGFMPDFPPLYEDLAVVEFLELFASAYGLPRTERAARIAAVIEVSGLAEYRRALAGGLSRGLKQRLFLAKTLLHEPDVIVLDEPASGLDPAARDELAAAIRALAGAGKAVVVSSHILSEMESFCSHVGIMEQGEMRVAGKISEVLAGLHPARSISLSLARPDERLDAFLLASPGVSNAAITSESARFQLDGGVQEAAELLRRLVQADFELADFAQADRGLQDIYRQLSSGGKS